MTTVAAITQGVNTPSARFRVRQHIGELRSRDISLWEYPSKIEASSPKPMVWGGRASSAAWAALKVGTRLPDLVRAAVADVRWLQRPLLPGWLTLERLVRRPFVFDIDDAIWLRGPYGQRAVADICRRATAVSAGNEYIAEWVSRFSSNVELVPTAIDTERFSPHSGAPADVPTFGWTGSASTLPYLIGIESALDLALRSVDGRIVVVADRPPSFRSIDPARVEFRRWTPQSEVESLDGVDVGLMPLPDDPWTRGKCGLKLLQYAARAIPSVGSPIGVNERMLAGGLGLPASTEDEWVDALVSLAKDPDARRDLGARAREAVLRDYSVPIVSELLAEVLHRAAA